jgi:dTMP kinase
VRRAPTPSGDPQPGRFIVLEGIDGSGKITQVGLLAAWLRESQSDVVVTQEPTDGEWGRRYRAWARNELDATPEEVLRFFVEDRREHVALVILPALARGAFIVSDRYYHSTLAYQAAHGVDRDLLSERLEIDALPQPNLVLWLRLPVALAVKRVAPDALEAYENASFLERADAEYARLGLEEIDASGSPEDVEEAIRARVSAAFGLAT